MKKHLLLTLLTIIGCGFINETTAQCSPDAQYIQIGVWPQVLPEACINVSYDETLTLVYPNDTCIVGFPQCFTLTNATITNVANLPLGIAHSCPNNCIYLPGPGETTANCFQISGTPTEAGTFTVVVTVALNTNAGSFNVDYDFDLTVNPVGVGGCTVTGIDISTTTNQLTVSPNPTNGTVQLSRTIKSATLKNTEGTTVLTLKNIDVIDMSSLSSGLYFLVTEEETLKIVKE